METRRDVFQAIADPTRREIIHLLSRQSLNLNAVADNFEISRPAISKHIKILTECGLIAIRQEGRERYCDAQLNKLKEVLQKNPATDAAIIIADLLIERQDEKVKTKRSFKANDNISDDEKW